MVNQRQAIAIDIDENARTGGTNFDLVVKHIRDGIYDFLIIKAGLGMYKTEIFDEQRSYAKKAGIPYITYHLPNPGSPNPKDPERNMIQQARKYVDWVGINQPAYIVDIESPYTGKGSTLPSKKALNGYLREIKKLTNKKPIIYTRMNILTSEGYTKGVADHYLWIADYAAVKSNLPPESAKNGKYRYIEDFLKDYKGTLPITVQGSNLKQNVILWQFSDKGKGQHYIYNELTDHPIYQVGKQSADLSISIKGRDELLKKLFGKIPDLPKAVPISDSLTDEQIDQLAKSGITPNMKVAISLDDMQIDEFVSQQEKLVKSGITPKIKVNLRTSISD